MRTDHGMPTSTGTRTRSTFGTGLRRPAVAALAFVFLLGAVAGGCSEDDPTADSPPGSTLVPASTPPGSTLVPATTPPGSTLVPATSPAATAVEQEPIGVATLPPVSLADPAQVESGLEFSVVAVRDVDVEPEEGTDDLVGPAVAIDIEVVNNGDDAVELNRFVVSAAGTESEFSSIPGTFNEPFAGVLEPGETATAMFGFRTGGESVTLLRLDDGLSRSIVIVEP